MRAVHPARILLAGDEFSTRRLPRLYLAKAGFTVGEAGADRDDLAALRRSGVGLTSGFTIGYGLG